MSKDDRKLAAVHGISPAALEVWSRCPLRGALGKNADEVLLDAVELHVEPSVPIFDITDANPFHLTMVVSGMARVYATSTQGRQATIRYVTEGDVAGLPVVLAPQLYRSSSLAVQSLTRCHLLTLSPQRFRQVASSAAENMWPLFAEFGRSLYGSYYFLARNVFQPVRARVARHMLDLSEHRNGQVLVTASQQDIADAVGSVREVVSRALVALRDEGIIQREGNAYLILDLARLHLASCENE